MDFTDVIRGVRKLAFTGINGDRTWTPDLMLILTDDSNVEIDSDLLSEVYISFKSKSILLNND